MRALFGAGVGKKGPQMAAGCIFFFKCRFLLLSRINSKQLKKNVQKLLGKSGPDSTSWKSQLLERSSQEDAKFKVCENPVSKFQS